MSLLPRRLADSLAPPRSALSAWQLQGPGADNAVGGPRRFEAFEQQYPFLCSASTKNNATKQ